jgi:hypothetical protein
MNCIASIVLHDGFKGFLTFNQLNVKSDTMNLPDTDILKEFQNWK